MDFYARLGERLRALRVEAGLSQAAVGARLGRSASAIDRYELGERRVSLQDLFRLARILEVSPEAFFQTHGPRSGAVGVRRARRGAVDRLRAEHLRLLRALDARLSSPVEPAGVQEATRAYRTRRAAARTAAPDAYAAAISPGRLRALARRAGLAGEPDVEALRRYAALVAADLARRAGRDSR